MVDPARDTASTILDAARDEVAAHGIRRTTASDIARRAGVSRQTLYRYWPDAQAVFAALVTRELLDVLPEAAPRARDLDELTGLLVGTADVIRRMPIVARLRESDAELFGRYILERLGTSQRAIHAEISRRLAAGQEDGIVRAGDPGRMAAMVLLVLQSAVQSAPLVAEWIDDAAWVDETARVVRGYLAAGA